MICVVCFSPTGNTREAAGILAETIQNQTNAEIEFLDITEPEEREKEYTFTADDLLIAACPTYAGRVPNKIMPFFAEKIHGNGCTCVTLVTYGNRSYDSSLLELSTLMEKNDCCVIGACALAASHAMSKTLGADRMNEDDENALIEFGEKIAKKWSSDHKEAVTIPGEIQPYYTPLREDGEKAVFLKAKPERDEQKCIGCGACAEACPMGSIEKEMPYACQGICIKCQACLHVCPVQARYFTHEDLLSHIRMLEKNYGQKRSENAFFL